MSDQAEAVDPLDALANMVDEPEKSEEDQSLEGEETKAESEEVEETEADEQADEKSDVKVKLILPDGEKEVSLEELKSGYMQQADYTRKTQDLANRERETAQIVLQRVEHSQEVAEQAAQQADAIVQYSLGMRSPEQMMQLAQTDPAAYTVEKQRMEMIQTALGGLKQRADQARQVAEEQRLEMAEKAKKASWERLTAEKIDRPALQKIYTETAKLYGMEAHEFDSLLDARAVLIMRDAIAYRNSKTASSELIAKTQKQAASAPTLKPKATEPPQIAKDNASRKKILSGRGSLHDLAALL